MSCFSGSLFREADSPGIYRRNGSAGTPGTPENSGSASHGGTRARTKAPRERAANDQPFVGAMYMDAAGDARENVRKGRLPNDPDPSFSRPGKRRRSSPMACGGAPLPILLAMVCLGEAQT